MLSPALTRPTAYGYLSNVWRQTCNLEGAVGINMSSQVWSRGSTLCSKKVTPKFKSLTTAYLIRIKYPLSGFNYLIEEWRCFDQNIIDRAVGQWRVRLHYRHVSVQTAAILALSTNCNWCFCVRTAKATFPYWKLLFLSSISKTAVAQKLCGGFYWNLQRLRRKDDN